MAALGALWAVGANGSTDPAAVAKALVLLKGSDEKLASAGSLHAVYTESDEHPGEYQDLRQIGTLTLDRPDRIRLEIVRARRVKASDPWKDSGNTTLSVSDGHEAHSVFFHAVSTQVRSFAPTGAPKLAEAPLLAGFFEGNRSPATALSDADRAGTLDDVQVNGSEIKFRAGDTDRTVLIGKDGLIHRLVARNLSSGVTRTWTLDSISLDSRPSASTFEYSAPKEAIPYPTAERSQGILTGELAPDFEVYGVDKAPAHLSTLKGKVVVLEFWATWCWPCNQSIPETHRLVNTYRDQGVESLLVSIKDSRKGFDAWVKAHPQFKDLRFEFDDPSNGQAYEAFLHPQNPTLYIIGRDGKVLFRKEGYAGPDPKVENAIKAALQ